MLLFFFCFFFFVFFFLFFFFFFFCFLLFFLWLLGKGLFYALSFSFTYYCVYGILSSFVITLLGRRKLADFLFFGLRLVYCLS